MRPAPSRHLEGFVARDEPTSLTAQRMLTGSSQSVRRTGVMTAPNLFRGRRRPTRVLPLGVLGLLLVVTLTSCLSTPGRTDQIELLSTRIVGDWSYSYYRNNAYPCSISGRDRPSGVVFGL